MKFTLNTDLDGKQIAEIESTDIDSAMQQFLNEYLKVSLKERSYRGDITEYSIIEDGACIDTVSSYLYEIAVQEALTILGYTVFESCEGLGEYVAPTHEEVEIENMVLFKL